MRATEAATVKRTHWCVFQPTLFSLAQKWPGRKSPGLTVMRNHCLKGESPSFSHEVPGSEERAEIFE
jgi:hypothetical protein